MHRASVKVTKHSPQYRKLTVGVSANTKMIELIPSLKSATDELQDRVGA